MTGSKFRSELKVKNINIYNLWGRDEISIPIHEKVTFLTGINGSGKSSLLNIFFDSLVLDPKKMKMPGTSKNRFWSSRCTFTNDFIIETLILPYLDNNVDLDKLDERLKDNLSDVKVIKEVQNVFFEAES
ncbi:AAA family ATPase, partial [Vibrio alginolyticus]|nr:AAA family ATPase [Vibrio alginolyticus]